LRERVKEVVARVLQLEPAAVPDDARNEQLAGWDSLSQLELMLEIEREFAVRVPTEAMLELTSVPKIEAFLAQASPE